MLKLGAIHMTPQLRNELARIGFGLGAGGTVGAAISPEGERLKGGVIAALADLGIMGAERVPDLIRHLRHVKVGAADVSAAAKLRGSIARLLSGAAGEHIVRLPIASALGGGAGYVIGKRLGSKDPTRQAATGAVLPIVGTTATLGAIPLRRALIRSLL